MQITYTSLPLYNIYASIKMLFMFPFLPWLCFSLSQMFYSSMKVLITSGPNTRIPMVLRYVLSKCHNFPINGQRNERITTGRTAKERKSPGHGNMKARRWCDPSVWTLQSSDELFGHATTPWSHLRSQRPKKEDINIESRNKFIKSIILGQNTNTLKYYQTKLHIIDC